MKIAFIIESGEPEISGPKNSVTNLVHHMHQLSLAECTVFSTLASDIYDFNSIEIQPICEDERFASFDVVVFSTIFNVKALSIAKRLRRAGKPYFISPRASLTKKSMYKSTFKKAAFFLFGGYQFIKNAKAIHFLNQDEFENSLRMNESVFFATNPLAIDPSVGGVKELCLSHKEINVAFIGRYDVYHKGLDLMMEQLNSHQNEFRSHSILFHFYGGSAKGGKKDFEKLVVDSGVEDFCFVHGPIFGASKLKVMYQSDIFIHLSRYEGQPQAVMEALGMGTPVIVSPGTNMGRFVQENKCGEVYDGSQTLLSCILRIQNSERYNSQSKNAKEASEKYFSGAYSANAFFKGISQYL